MRAWHLIYIDLALEITAPAVHCSVDRDRIVVCVAARLNAKFTEVDVFVHYVFLNAGQARIVLRTFSRLMNFLTAGFSRKRNFSFKTHVFYLETNSNSKILE